MTITFAAELWVWTARHDDGWTFVSLPVDPSGQIRDMIGSRRGFGSVRVRARIGGTVWRTSIFPDSTRDCYVLPIKRAVRAAESIDAGDRATVTVEVLDLPG